MASSGGDEIESDSRGCAPLASLFVHTPPTIPALLEDHVTLSFEFFPPKTEAASETLLATLDELEQLHPDFVSVTYGAGGSTRDRTHEIVSSIREDTPMLPMAHLTCVGHRRAELEAILARYAEANVTHILALRGDPPNGVELDSELDHAIDLVELIRSCGDFVIGVAAHPEGHPASTSKGDDLDRQSEKLSLADFAVTQMFFEADVYSEFVDAMAARGVTTPVIPGIMPVTNLAQVARMAELSGAAFPAEVETRLRSAESADGGVAAEGIAIATELSEELVRRGAPGLHYFTLNKSRATREIASQVSAFIDRTH